MSTPHCKKQKLLWIVEKNRSDKKIRLFRLLLKSCFPENLVILAFGKNCSTEEFENMTTSKQNRNCGRNIFDKSFSVVFDFFKMLSNPLGILQTLKSKIRIKLLL